MGRRPVHVGHAERPTELSIVCRAERVPAEVPGEDGWRCLYLDDTFDLSLVGVLHSVTGPLASAAGVSIFTIATYDTDYVLVRRFDRGGNGAARRRARGHRRPRRLSPERCRCQLVISVRGLPTLDFVARATAAAASRSATLAGASGSR